MSSRPAADLSSASKQVLEALCEAAEGISYNYDWRDVYLDNAYAKLKSTMSVTSFRSHLATLSKAGFYKVIDGYAWGAVKDEAFQVLPKEGV